jgi:hypothetical protein
MLKTAIKKTAITKMLSCFLVFVILMSAVPVSASTDQAEILEFKHTTGTVNPKSRGTALVAIENTGTNTRSFWVGLSYKKQGASEWIDIKPQQSIDLEPSLSTNVQFSWTLTSESGTYDIFTKIWNSYDTSTKKMIPPSYDEQIDEGAFTIASASHELDYDNIAKYMSNATTFYSGYTDKWFNSEYWHNLAKGTVSEGVSNSLEDFFEAPTDYMAEQFLLPKYLHSTTGAASIAGAMINIGAGILGLFYGTVYNIMSYIIKTGSSYSDLLNYLNALKANSKDIKSAAENRDENTIKKLFIARKNILEDLYSTLPMYDSDVRANLRTGMDIFQLIGVVGDTGYRAYRTVKPFIISLHLQLQMDYIFTTYQLNRIAGIEGFEELNLVVHAPICPTRFDNDPGCSVLIGCVDAIGGSNEFEIILGANDVSSNKELRIELAYCPKTKDDLDGITMYVKYGEKPTTSSYDEKGRHITIKNPKQGSYYVLLKAENVPGMYRLVAQVYKPNWLQIPICKSVTINSKGFVFEQYPQPEVVDIRVDKGEFSLNEWVTLTVKVTNKGGTASWQSIAISSPNVTSVDSYEILSHNIDYFEKYDIGYEAGFNYGTGTKVLEYPLIEGGKYNWTKRFNGEVKLKIKPKHVGDLRIYVKSVAFGEGVWQSNPEIFGSPTKDQQEEYVHVKEVTVIGDPETTLPKLCTAPDPPTTNFGTVPEDQTKTRDFHITNCGSGTLTWTITCDQPWLNVNPASDSTTKEVDVVTVTVDTYELDPGTHTGQITIDSNGGRKTGTIMVEVPNKKPFPKIIEVTYPTTCVKEDEYATISVSVTNNGGTSSEGYISVSFPNGEDVSVVSGTGDETIYPIDSWICNSKGEQMKSVDPLVELLDTSWGKGQQKTITMNVKPDSGSNEIVFYVRAALKNDADGSYERDPTFGETDQQGWYAKKYSVDVCSGMDEVRFKGIVTNILTSFSAAVYTIQIDDVISDYTGSMYDGDTARVSYPSGSSAHVDSVEVGDKVEVHGTYAGYESGEHTIALEDTGSSLIKLGDTPLLWKSEIGYTPSIDISGDGNYVVAGSDKNVYLFDKTSDTPKWEKPLADTVCHVAISNDGNYIVVGSNDSVYYFDKDQNPLWNKKAGDLISSVTVSDNGNYVAFTSWDGYVYYYDKTGFRWSYKTKNPPTSVSISSDGEKIAVGCFEWVYYFNKNGFVWDYESGEWSPEISISSDGEYVAIAGGWLYYLDKNKNVLWDFDPPEGSSSVKVSSDGEYIVLGSGNSWRGWVYYFSKDSNIPIWKNKTTHWVSSVDMSSNGEYVVAGSYPIFTLYYFDNTGELLFDYPIDVISAKISSDGKYIAAADGWEGAIGCGVYFFGPATEVPPPESEPKLCTSPDPPTTNFGTVPEDQTRTRDFFITNSGSGTLTWTITCDQPSWLNVNPASNSTTKEVDVVTVTIATHDLTPGTHTGQITLTSNGGEKTGTITVNVPPPAQEPKLCTSPDPPTTNFGTVPEDQTRTWDFFITNCGSGTLTWTITCDQPSWLNVNRAIGSTTTLDVVTVTIDTHDLSPGTHTGHVTLTSNGGEKTGTITVNVGFKGIVLFPCTYGDFTGQGIDVTKILSDPNGKLANCKNVCSYWTENTLAQIENVACGDEVEVYGTLIEDPDVAEDWMIVRLETSTHYIVRLKQGPPQLCTSPTTLLHDFGTVDKDQTRTWDFDVRNCGSGTLTWSVSDDKNWRSVYPTSGSTTTERDTVIVRIDTQGLSPGTHTGHITLTSNGGEKTGTITVVVPKPKPQNQPPENPTLTPDRSSPQLAGTTIKWTASATDPDGDPLYYQFRLKGPATGNSWQIKRDWSTARRWTWYTTASDVGDTDISVRIRDGHHASTGSYDLKKTVYDYKITADKKRPTATIDSITPNPATQGDDTVRFKGHGYDSDGYIVDYYWKSSKDGKLSSSKEFTKSASNLAVGTHTIYFKVEDDDGQWSDWATMTLKIEKKEDSEYVKFRGVVTWKSAMRMGGASWVVNVDEWISGSISCDEIEVIWGSGLSHGSFDPDISTGDRVEAYGKVNPWGNDKCSVGLNDESHYIKKV